MTDISRPATAMRGIENVPASADAAVLRRLPAARTQARLGVTYRENARRWCVPGIVGHRRRFARRAERALRASAGLFRLRGSRADRRYSGAAGIALTVPARPVFIGLRTGRCRAPVGRSAQLELRKRAPCGQTSRGRWCGLDAARGTREFSALSPRCGMPGRNGHGWPRERKPQHLPDQAREAAVDWAHDR